MVRVGIFLAALLAALAFPSSFTAADAAGKPARTVAAASTPTAEAQSALTALNAYRKKKKRSAVVFDPTLTKMAQDLVNACMKARRCDHNTGGSFQQRAARYGFTNIYGAENLMVGGTTLDQAFAWWQASQVHSDNMLIKQVTRMGFARGPTNGAAWWVLIVTSDPM